MAKIKVLFICTGNSVRSQLAEGLLRQLAPDHFEIFSAGIMPAGIHPYTETVLSEIGIDLTGQWSKSIWDLPGIKLDYVIFLCEVAALSCPAIPGNHQTLNWFIDDPIRFMGPEPDRLKAFQATRDAIRDKISTFIEDLI
jgi:arsenate reductase